MREIKFRAWEKNLKEIIPVYSVDFEKRIINTESAWRFLDEVELMQYKGKRYTREISSRITRLREIIIPLTTRSAK